MAKRGADEGHPREEDAGDRSRQVAGAPQLYKPTARECALLLLHLISLKEEESGRAVTRLRISELSLKRLWCRRRVSPELAEDVADWLASAGVTFFFAGSTYAVVKTAVVEGWPRTTTKPVKKDLQAVAQGSFDFTTLNHLLTNPDQDGDDD